MALFELCPKKNKKNKKKKDAEDFKTCYSQVIKNQRAQNHNFFMIWLQPLIFALEYPIWGAFCPLSEFFFTS